jgi:hypothetical protein
MDADAGRDENTTSRIYTITCSSHPHAHMTFAMRDVMAKYELHTSRGFGARIGERDIWDLMLAITTAPEYRTIKWDEISAGRGVRIKENTMWGLREALRNAKVQRAK